LSQTSHERDVTTEAAGGDRLVGTLAAGGDDDVGTQDGLTRRRPVVDVQDQVGIGRSDHGYLVTLHGVLLASRPLDGVVTWAGRAQGRPPGPRQVLRAQGLLRCRPGAARRPARRSCHPRPRRPELRSRPRPPPGPAPRAAGRSWRTWCPR